jgi:hypothetical protein
VIVEPLAAMMDMQVQFQTQPKVLFACNLWVDQMVHIRCIIRVVWFVPYLLRKRPKESRMTWHELIGSRVVFLLLSMHYYTCVVDIRASKMQSIVVRTATLFIIEDLMIALYSSATSYLMQYRL